MNLFFLLLSPPSLYSSFPSNPLFFPHPSLAPVSYSPKSTITDSPPFLPPFLPFTPPSLYSSTLFFLYLLSVFFDSFSGPLSSISSLPQLYTFCFSFLYSFSSSFSSQPISSLPLQPLPLFSFIPSFLLWFYPHSPLCLWTLSSSSYFAFSLPTLVVTPPPPPLPPSPPFPSPQHPHSFSYLLILFFYSFHFFYPLSPRRMVFVDLNKKKNL